VEKPEKCQCVREEVVSEITGLALPTLRNYRFMGKGIPYLKLGRSVRYDLRDVYAYLENAKVETRG
jgi:predicted DNA-binding transcriptional regulator AlpA